MDQIVKFSVLLRENGIPASIRSSQTACQVMNLFGKDEPRLKEALASVYVKSYQQRQKFDELYQSFFGEEVPLQKEDLPDKRPLKSVKILPNQGKIQYQFFLNEDQDSDTKVAEINSAEIDYNPPLEDYIDLDEDKDLLHQDINTLDSFQPELFQLCQELGKKIATVRSRRMRKSNKMKPDVRRTIRKNLQNGGTLLELVKNRPPLKNSNYYFLCDVSGSCDWISNWFFCLVYAAQYSFRRIRVFDFDHKVVETTTALGESGLLDAFTRVRDIRQKNLMIHSTSNMYQAFKAFEKKAVLNRRSNVVLLTDCRDWAGPKEDGKPLSADLIEKIKRQARRVIIFNPEEEKKWDVVDSCVSEYRDAGAQIHEVRNLEQLARLVSLI
ncbi:MAG TPA: VWA domain-containing protein [Methanobacteriaceae archaeon]|nr:VWA domain-containing protein [Methanobacteriaceae archaeon]